MCGSIGFFLKQLGIVTVYFHWCLLAMVFCKVSEGVVFGQNKDLLNFGAHPDLLLFFAR